MIGKNFVESKGDRSSSESSEEFRLTTLLKRKTYVLHKRQSFLIKSFSKFLEEAKKDFYERYGTLISNQNTSINDFKLLRKIGEDDMSFSINACFIPDSDYYILKIAKKEHLVRNKKVYRMFRERDIVGAVRFDFILSMMFCFKDNANIYLVSQYMPGGDFFTYLRQCVRLDENQAKFFAAQVYLGLEYLHYLNIIYRDLKPEHVMIDSKGYIKLSNFSTAKLRNKCRTYSFCGTPDYVSPEMILGNGHGLASDWWAYGVFIYEMIEGFPPFHTKETTNLEQFEKILSANYKFTTNFSSLACDLIKKLLQVDATKRLGNLKNKGYDIKKHQWFNEIQFKALLNCTATAPYIPENETRNDNGNDLIDLIQRAKENLYSKEFQNF